AIIRCRAASRVVRAAMIKLLSGPPDAAAIHSSHHHMFYAPPPAWAVMHPLGLGVKFFLPAGKICRAGCNGMSGADTTTGDESMDQPCSDLELLARVGSDAGAMAELVRRHGVYLYGVARALVGDAHEAEDVVQETFTAVLSRASGAAAFRGESA